MKRIRLGFVLISLFTLDYICLAMQYGEIKQDYPTLVLDTVDEVIRKNPYLQWHQSQWKDENILYYSNDQKSVNPEFSPEFLDKFFSYFKTTRTFSFIMKFDQRKNTNGTLVYMEHKNLNNELFKFWIHSSTSDKGTVDLRIFLQNPFTRQKKYFFKKDNITLPLYTSGSDHFHDPIWQQLLITLTRKSFQIYLNCILQYNVELRRNYPNPKVDLSTSNNLQSGKYDLLENKLYKDFQSGSLGYRKRINGRQNLYSGFIKEAAFLFLSNSEDKLCNEGSSMNNYVQFKSPDIDTPSILATDYSKILIDNVENLQRSVNILMKKIENLDLRLKQRESCQCLPKCSNPSNGMQYILGSKWQPNPCKTCECTVTGTLCIDVECQRIDCKNPIKLHGQCCPICPENCKMAGKTISHGQTVISDCTECICQHGDLKCRTYEPKEICPTLNCPDFLQHKQPNECCPRCRKLEKDFCSRLKQPCHENAQCISKLDNFTCKCHEGYHGDGKKGTKNWPVGKLNSDNATIRGCLPICDETCANGGECIKPNLCYCSSGFTGTDCKLDINECSIDKNICPENSTCHNLYGSFKCECQHGFQYNATISECQEKDLCQGIHGVDYTCSKHENCMSNRTAYTCLSDTNQDCHVVSKVNNVETALIVQSNEIILNPWSKYEDPDYCDLCVCSNGNLNCPLWHFDRDLDKFRQVFKINLCNRTSILMENSNCGQLCSNKVITSCQYKLKGKKLTFPLLSQFFYQESVKMPIKLCKCWINGGLVCHDETQFYGDSFKSRMELNFTPDLIECLSAHRDENGELVISRKQPSNCTDDFLLKKGIVTQLISQN